MCVLVAVCESEHRDGNVSSTMQLHTCMHAGMQHTWCSMHGAAACHSQYARAHTDLFFNHFNRVKITVGGRETRVSLHNNVMRVLLLFVCVCM